MRHEAAARNEGPFPRSIKKKWAGHFHPLHVFWADNLFAHDRTHTASMAGFTLPYCTVRPIPDIYTCLNFAYAWTNPHASTRFGYKPWKRQPAPNGGSKLHFAMNKDENKVINKGTASQSLFRAAHNLHFKPEEKKAQWGELSASCGCGIFRRRVCRLARWAKRHWNLLSASTVLKAWVGLTNIFDMLGIHQTVWWPVGSR